MQPPRYTEVTLGEREHAVMYLLAAERLIPYCREGNSPHQIQLQAINISKTYILGIYLKKEVANPDIINE